MPRKARKLSQSGIYHIIIRGINRQTIFEDEEDCLRFIGTLQKCKEKSGYQVYAYCLMGNHVHLLIKVGFEALEQVMRRIGGSYVYWYNKKYQRVGNLFQDRFKSEPVEDDIYFKTVLRYIHQNPVKAGLVKRVEEYKWSSCCEYISQYILVDVNFFLDMLSDDREIALLLFKRYNNEVTEHVCLDINNDTKLRVTDEEARSIIKAVYKVTSAKDMQNLDITIRNKYLRELKDKYKLTVRQIERLTGINRGIVLKT